MHLNDGFGDRQSKPRFTRLGTGRIATVEAVEDVRQGFGGDPAVVILNGQHQRLPGAPRGQPDPAAFRGIAQSIGDQVSKDLRHTVRIEREGRQTGFGLDFQLNFLLHHQGAVGPDRPFKQHGGQDGLPFEDWQRGGEHTEYGHITILGQTLRSVSHDAVHLRQLADLAGRPEAKKV